MRYVLGPEGDGPLERLGDSGVGAFVEAREVVDGTGAVFIRIKGGGARVFGAPPTSIVNGRTFFADNGVI